MRSAERYTHSKDPEPQKLDTIIGRLSHTGIVLLCHIYFVTLQTNQQRAVA